MGSLLWTFVLTEVFHIRPYQCGYPSEQYLTKDVQDTVGANGWRVYRFLSLLFLTTECDSEFYLYIKSWMKKLVHAKECRRHTFLKCTLFIWEELSRDSALWERHLSSSWTSRSIIYSRQSTKIHTSVTSVQ